MSPDVDLRKTLLDNAALSLRIAREVAHLHEQGVDQRLAAISACLKNAYQPHTVWWPTIFGSYMELDLREEISQGIYLYGAIEPSLLACLTRLLRPGDVFFDVGAHIGFFSIAAAKLVGPHGKVVAFEPTPETFRRLTVNLANSGCGHAEPVNNAVWSESKTLTFNDFGTQHSAFNSVFAPRMEGQAFSAAAIQVEAVRLDDVARAKGLRPNVVKIDVESAEAQVIAGMVEIIEAVAPTLSIEVGDFESTRDDGVLRSRELLSKLEGLGYALFDLTNAGGVTPHEISATDYSYANILAIHESRLAQVLPALTD